MTRLFRAGTALALIAAAGSVGAQTVERRVAGVVAFGAPAFGCPAPVAWADAPVVRDEPMRTAVAARFNTRGGFTRTRTRRIILRS